MGEEGFYVCEPMLKMFLDHCPWPAKVVTVASPFVVLEIPSWVAYPHQVQREHVGLTHYGYPIGTGVYYRWYGWHEASRTVFIHQEKQ